MSHLSKIAEAAEKLNITKEEARALIPTLRAAWEEACSAHDAAVAHAIESHDFSKSCITSKRLSEAQRALNAAQWASGERWGLKVD